MLPARTEFVIRSAHVLTMDAALGDLPDGDIHVRDGAIVAVGTGLAVPPGAAVLDGRRMIALPGLIDTHWHMWGALARNMAGEEPKTGYFPLSRVLGAVFTPEDNARGVRLALAEALHGGITTVHNWSHNLLAPAYVDAELRTHQEVGLRARFSYGYSRATKANEMLPLDDVRRVRDEWFADGEGLLTLGIATQGPMGNALEISRAEWDAARGLGLPITTHIGVQPGKDTCLKQYADAGLLGPDVLVIHAVTASAEDFDILGATGTPVSLSPYTELRTGFGFPQIAKFLAAGVRLGLSVDTTMLCGNADMFAIMRGMQNIANGLATSEFAIPARRVLEMATIDGARALGIGDRTGSLTPNKRADIILVRTTDLNIGPMTDPVRMIVQSAQPANVDTVIVDGRILKRDGRLVALAADRIMDEAAETLARVRRTTGA